MNLREKKKIFLYLLYHSQENLEENKTNIQIKVKYSIISLKTRNSFLITIFVLFYIIIKYWMPILFLTIHFIFISLCKNYIQWVHSFKSYTYLKLEIL